MPAVFAWQMVSNRRNIMRLPNAILIATLMLSMNSMTTLAADSVNASATSASEVNADAISRADHALRDYLLACSVHDAQAIGRAVTADAVFEYVLEEPGSYLTIDATSLRAHCAVEDRAGESPLRISNLRIFPTSDSNAVFVRYTTPAVGDSPRAVDHSELPATTSEHLALIELRGDRIAKLRDFTTTFEESSRGLVRR
jgi:hypothetical protein